MNPIATLRRHFANVERSRQLLEEIREGVANLTDVTNRHLIKLQELMEQAIGEPDGGGEQPISPAPRPPVNVPNRSNRP